MRLSWLMFTEPMFCAKAKAAIIINTERQKSRFITDVLDCKNTIILLNPSFFIIFAAEIVMTMPKLLLYITLKGTWIFLIFGTDSNENRMHVHVGRKDTKHYCKIWLQPKVELSKAGDLNNAELKEVLEIAEQYKDDLVKQWNDYMNGKLKMKIVRK